MNNDPLLALLDKLCAGDDAAAEEVFRTYEPYLRMVVRRQLPDRARSKFDSADIVQSVWADLVQGFREKDWHFADVNQFRAFLVKATRNRFLDRLRQHRRALEHEQPLPGGDAGPELPATNPDRPSALAQADDVWHRLLALCPPAHRELLQLKRQGLPLEEIARRTGLHPSSVRRILYELARQFDQQHPSPPERRRPVPLPG